MRPLSNRKGFNLLEVVLATLILSIVVGGLFQIQTFMSKQSFAIKDSAFANQKAMQMLEELRALVAGSEKADVTVLDDYDNGSNYSTVLTTDLHVTDPAAPLSGNTTSCKGWRYLRQINVIKQPEEAFARKVYVRVYRAKCPYDGTPDATLAETMSVLKTIKSDYVPTQVMDIYVLAIESVPGWWSALSTLRPTFDSVLQDIQTRNPGMEFRAHWITRMAYGRDPLYRPYVNDAVRTDAGASPWVYLYPGKTKASDNSDFYFYSPNLFLGKMNVDDNFSYTPGNYVMADQVNHAVRYPEEEQLYAEQVAAADAAGTAAPEISLRMLIEKLNTSTTKELQNIILINLHGELLPIPPIRNYSDAAKDPEAYPYHRVVTHPEKLQYTSTDTVKLRVYPYIAGTSPDSFSSTTTLPSMSITFPNDYIDASGITLTKITGNASVPYSSGTATFVTYFDSSTACIIHPSTGSTEIILYDTPMRHPANAYKGMPSGMRLYGMEYMPAPAYVSSAYGFARDLTLYDNTNALGKNTARWIINIDPSALSSSPETLTFETRIGTDTTTGTLANKPENISRSYTWRGKAPPETEKYQIMGDPRHSPYSDVMQYSGYNWYFNSVGSTAYPGFGKAAAGWGADDLDVDIPRMFQLYRTGLMKSGGIWSTMNGFSYYYFGMGGEFGSDMEPLPNALTYVKTPWSTSGETTVTGVDEIIEAHGSATIATNRLVAKTDGTWASKYWLGELFPDDQYSVWKSSGNLPTGSGNFYRAAWSTTFGTAAGGQYYSRNRYTRTQALGCSAFFNGKPASQTGPFKHYSASASGTLTTLGTNLSSLFNFPLITPVTTPRPFTLNYNSDFPPEWSDTTYSTQRTVTSVPTVGSTARIFYESSYSASTYDASSVVKVQSSTGTAYFIISGLGTQSDFGTAQLAKYTVLAMLRTFNDGGMYTGTDKITQIPTIKISSPSVTDMFVDPSTATIRWSYSWLRWDQTAYTEEYSSTYTDTAQLVYNIKYSADNGREGTWKFVSDGTTAKEGVFDSAHALYSPTSEYVWNISTLPRGSYIARVEAFRQGIPLHYSYSQVGIYVYR